ncbi:hypothetical protein [Aeromicrobium sp. IC_218]|uniref:hypothetical protein n=1 Tax=Aeromicrobium sp. IC_218 TaxID=2545468 RepID=UPI00103BA4EE|nr:hypothetical protein [Aeromicrobium sp. IC_218]TCI99794.1 hypothetical protein E0W78_05145 [Aeromicrobium sp. IC_218]
MASDPPAAPPPPELEPFDSLAAAWRVVAADPARVVGGSALVVLAGVLSVAGVQAVAGTSRIAWACWAIVLVAFWQVLAAVLVRAGLDALDGHDFDVVRAARSLPLPDVVLTGLLVATMTTVGTLLCVLPGVAVAVLTGFTPYVVLVERLGPVDAVRRSGELVVQHLGDVVSLMLLTLGIVLAGVLVACVGLVLALPVVYGAWGHAYLWFTRTPDVPSAAQ